MSLRPVLLAIAAALVITLLPSRADAYAWMIRHEYSACAQCHADPSGGSLLTLYGRAQSEILLRTRYGGGAEDDPGTTGNFLFGAVPLPESVLLGADFRVLHLRVKPEGGPLIPRTIWMQADVQGQVTVDRFRANASVGYAHEGARSAAITHWEANNIVSRTHWVGVDLGEDKSWLVRAGKFNLPFGLRTIEHTMWVRRETRTNINDNQQHGASVAYNAEPIRAEIMAIAGNFSVAPAAYRDRGYAGYLEWTLMPKFALGASSSIVHVEHDLLVQRAAFRHAHGLFWRYSPWKPIVILAEGDMLVLSPKKRPTAIGAASMLQVDVEPIQGIHVIGTGELLNAGVGDAPSSFGAWGSLQWFFLPHTDLRFDLVHQSVGAGGTRTGVTSLLFQLHAFL